MDRFLFCAVASWKVILSPKENVELNFSVDVDDKNDDDDDDDEDDATTNDFERHRHCRLDGVEAVATTPDT